METRRLTEGMIVQAKQEIVSLIDQQLQSGIPLSVMSMMLETISSGINSSLQEILSAERQAAFEEKIQNMNGGDRDEVEN